MPCRAVLSCAVLSCAVLCLLPAEGMKDAMTKLKQQAADLAARAAADAEEAAKFRSQAEKEYNSIAAELEMERQQVCGGGGWLGASFCVCVCVCVCTLPVSVLSLFSCVCSECA